MKLETVALWWCYLTGATAAIGLYGLIAMWAIDQITAAFKVKGQILQWYWEKCKAKARTIPGG